MSELPTVSKKPDRLRLRALDGDDLAILSAQLQDAIAPVADLQYLPEQQRFVIVFNRFCWDRPADSEIHERTLSAFEVHHVRQVQLRGFSLQQRDKMLALLGVTFEDGHLQLTFAAAAPEEAAALRLSVERLDARLEDFGEPWPTTRRPQHDPAAK